VKLVLVLVLVLYVDRICDDQGFLSHCMPIG